MRCSRHGLSLRPQIQCAICCDSNDVNYRCLASKVKEIASLVIDKLNAQSARSGYGATLGSDDVDDIQVTTASVNPEPITSGFLGLGHINVQVTITEK